MDSIVAGLAGAFLASAEVQGGAERYLCELGRGLAQIGTQTSLVGRLPGWAATGLPNIAVDVGPKWSRRSALRSLRDARAEQRAYLSALASLSTSMGIDWAHCQYKREQVLLTRRAATQVAVIWTEHGRLYQGVGSRFLLHEYERAAKSVAGVICVSADVEGDVRRLSPSGTPTIVIPSAVDTDVFAPVTNSERERLRQALLPPSWKDALIGVVAARLHPDKRLARALAAAANAEMSLLVLGDGPDAGLLHALADESRTIFLGHQTDVAPYLQLADVHFSCASPTEGSPRAILEAAACGLPTIGFVGDVGEDTIVRLGGLLVGTPLDCTPATIESAVGQVSTAGREVVVAEYSTPAWLDRHIEFIRTCLSGTQAW